MTNPVAGNWVVWEAIAQIGGGIGAILTGQPYDIYRIGPTSTGDFIQPSNKIFSSFPIVRSVYKADKQNRLESDKAFAALWLNLHTDFTQLRVGDVFVQNDPAFGPGYTSVTYKTDQINAVAFGARPPGAAVVGARLDRICQIYRIPGRANPLTGIMIETFDGSQPLMLVSGNFSLGADGDISAAAKVPIGFLPEKRARGETYKDIGDVPQMTMMKAYVPPLPGFRFRSNDIVVMADKSRFRVVNPYYQETGVMGSQLILQREVDNE